jgi:polar amino acid transport system substrate-binding protein
MKGRPCFALTLVISLVALTLMRASLTVAADLEEIKSRGQLIVAVKDNLRPLGFIDQKGNLVGLEIDLAHRLAQEILGDANAVKLQPVSNQDRLKVILDDRVDLVIARVSDTAARRRIVDLSPYYYLDGTGLISKKISLNNPEELQQAKIALLKNSATIAVIKSKFPNAHLIGVDSYQEALELLEINQADAFAADLSVLTGWSQEYPQYKLLSVRLSGEALCIVMPKGLQYQELRQQVRDAIAVWQESGWLHERIKYWGLPESNQPMRK